MNKSIKKFITAATALFAAIAMVMPITAQAAVSIGEYLHQSRIDIAADTVLTENAFWNNASGRQQEYFAEVKPGPTAMPKVVYGSKLYGTSDINDIEKYLDKNGFKGVAGINADYFSTKTGLPLGMVVTDGILRCSDAGSAAVGFDVNGAAIIGNPQLYLKATVGTETVLIDHFNKLRQPYALYMMTSDFSSSTRNTTPGTDVVLRIKDGKFSVGGTVHATVESKTPYDGAIALEEGMVVITCDAGGPLEKLALFEPGVEVTFEISPTDSRFKGIQDAVGGGEKLLSAGKVVSGLAGGTAPRTAFGIKADGTFVMYVNDGRQKGYSVGLTLTEVATRLLDLGCVEAINFDGGGSTAISTDYPGTGNLKIINSPSDGVPRKCANYIFLVNTTNPTNSAEKLFLYPYDILAMSGGEVALTPKATDKNFHATAVPKDISYSLSEGMQGSLSGGKFTAAEKGSGRIDVTGGGASGFATVNVVDPDEMTVKNEATGKEVQSLAPKLSQTVNLTATGFYKTFEIYSRDSSFQWAVSGDIGEIDQNGTFTATSIPGKTGSIVVTVAGLKKEIPVKVGKEPVMLATFEDTNYSASVQNEFVTIGEESNTDFVKYGKKSLRLHYNLLPPASQGANTRADLWLQTTDSPAYLNLYVYGNGTNTELKLVTQSGGGETLVDVGNLAFWGYRQISVKLPAGTKQITGFELRNIGDAPTFGTFYIDQLQVVYSPYLDEVPPIITLDPINSVIGASSVTVTGTVRDELFEISPDKIILTLDGVRFPAEYNPQTGALVAEIAAPDDLKPHRVSVEATDKSGNIGKKSVVYNEGLSDLTSFVDTGDHWAGNYAEYLYSRGVLGGEMEGALRYFYPDRNMTRAELAKIITNYLKLDINAYSGAALPYKDLAAIPEWALPYVKAMYATGIIRGKDMGGGISYDPGGNVTRAEMMTILGRTQLRGHASVTPTFKDSLQIPDYAYSYVGTLVAQGIVSGYDDGTLRPNQVVKRGEMAKMFFSLY